MKRNTQQRHGSSRNLDLVVRLRSASGKALSGLQAIAPRSEQIASLGSLLIRQAARHEVVGHALEVKER